MIIASYDVLLREKNSKVCYLITRIVMLTCEPDYGTYTDDIKPSSNGTGVNMTPGIDENKNTKIRNWNKIKVT